MRVKIVSAMIWCVLAYSQGIWAHDPVSHTDSVFPEKVETKSESLPMPPMSVRAELTQQLMELAMTDVDPIFSQTWLALNRDEGRTSDPETYFRIYSLLHQFRQHWYTLSLDKREHLAIGHFHPVFTEEQRQSYLIQLHGHGLVHVVDKLRPHSANYLASRKMLLKLLDQARGAPWPELKAAKIQPDDENEQLPAVRDALIRAGDLDPATLTDQMKQSLTYDATTVAAIKHFQERHGLLDDGIIGRKTFYWLSMPPYTRAVILARSMLRSDIPEPLERQPFVVVNIPEYQLRVWDGESVIFTSRVIVGKSQRQTPIFQNHISSVVLNPAWHVPSSILKKDLIPKLAKNKDLLDKEQFEIINDQGETVNPSEIAWDDADNSFPYRLRQKPGDHNALGRYKFYLPNSDEIYLHSTSSPSYFKLSKRALSSGCVRVQDADTFAHLLLKSQWSASKLDDMLNQEKTKWLPISTPVPVYTVYWRSWVDTKGELQFRDDIYDFDDDVSMASSAVSKSIVGNS